jgi:phosphatidylserine/phosphatidylglycerophosphate/cardiolipin synthase-like enzyme
MRALSALLAIVLATPSFAEPRAPAIELVESAPVETSLEHDDIPDAKDVWLQMIASARRTIDLSEFYVVDRAPSRLTPILRALAAAVDRGVRVRLIVDADFARHEHETLEQLEHAGKLQIRRYDLHRVTGGVQHAKYFIVDGRDAFLGSQNLDWRSLEHIQELGVRVRVPELVRPLADIFERDWSRAGTPAATPSAAPAHAPDPATDPARAPVAVEGAGVQFVASPRDLLPDRAEWDLPRIVQLIDGAKSAVRVQLLTYETHAHGALFDTLDAALRRAAARGVRVRLLVADWNARPGAIDALKSLSAVPNLEVGLMSIPASTSGFIPYARVIHAKYAVADSDHAWIGTNNWARDYFFASRNVGLVISGAAFATRASPASSTTTGRHPTPAGSTAPTNTRRPARIRPFNLRGSLATPDAR